METVDSHIDEAQSPAWITDFLVFLQGMDDPGEILIALLRKTTSDLTVLKNYILALPDKDKNLSTIYQECLVAICNRGQTAIDFVMKNFKPEGYSFKSVCEYTPPTDCVFTVDYEVISSSLDLGEVMSSYQVLFDLLPFCRIIPLTQRDGKTIISISLPVDKIVELENAVNPSMSETSRNIMTELMESQTEEERLSFLQAFTTPTLITFKRELINFLRIVDPLDEKRDLYYKIQKDLLFIIFFRAGSSLARAARTFSKGASSSYTLRPLPKNSSLSEPAGDYAIDFGVTPKENREAPDGVFSLLLDDYGKFCTVFPFCTVSVLRKGDEVILNVVLPLNKMSDFETATIPAAGNA